MCEANEKEFVDEVNFERNMERIMLRAKKIYDIAIEAGFDDIMAEDFVSQYYAWEMGYE